IPPIADHFTWGPIIPTTRYVNTPFVATLTARDPAGAVLTNYMGTAFLDSTNVIAYPALGGGVVPVSPSALSNFVQGVWTGSVVLRNAATNLVLRASDGLGHIGLANPINVISLPALTQRISGNTLQFIWPTGYPGFALVSSESLESNTWIPVAVSPF